MPNKKKERCAQRKMGRVMGEYKRGALNSGSSGGPRVKSRKQAVAIAMAESRRKCGGGRTTKKRRK